jgi:hypothetical protein
MVTFLIYSYIPWYNLFHGSTKEDAININAIPEFFLCMDKPVVRIIAATDAAFWMAGSLKKTTRLPAIQFY